MTLTSFMFYFFETLAAISAIAMALSRNVFYGALLLIVCLLSLAGIYVLAFAEFVAITQILIYAGGILVVIIFGIMLTTKISSEKPLTIEHNYIMSGIIAAVGCFCLLAYVLSQQFFHSPTAFLTPPSVASVQTVGVSIFSMYSLPFEIAGILLLISLVGASVIASSIKSKKE